MAVTRVSKSSITDYNKSNLMSGGRGLGSGGDYTGDANGFRYHIFTSSGTFTATSSGAVEYLVIGGGGAGGYRASAANIGCGGGGAGGVLRGATVLSAGDYTVTVGAGGVATDDVPTSGTDTSFGSIATAFGGGGGSTQSSANNALSGASGGGGASSNAAAVGSDGAEPKGVISGTGLYDGVGEQGHAGGHGDHSNNNGMAGGGGGAGGAGHTGFNDGNWESRTTSEFWGERANGGFGVRHDDFGADATTIAGTAIGDAYTYTPDAGGTAIAYLFGGGGAGGYDDGTEQRLGGPGGGGDGASSNTVAENGTDYTGGGGGGGANNLDAGDGGSGIVILRYGI